MFSTFPDRWPGAGLLLLRLACAGVFIVQGAACFGEKRGLDLLLSAVGFLMIVAGALLLIGVLTRFAALTGAVIGVASMVPWLSSHNIDLVQGRMTGALLVVIALALACIGPGAFSLDGRLFGHREIVIPPPSSSNSSIEN
jgi:uncharacterized membrane protein YphA (DoxX/SURF4 family)